MKRILALALQWSGHTHILVLHTRQDNRSGMGRRRFSLSNIKRDRRKANGRMERGREEPDGYGGIEVPIGEDTVNRQCSAHFSVKVVTNDPSRPAPCRRSEMKSRADILCIIFICSMWWVR